MKARNIALVVVIVACAVYIALDQSETWITEQFAAPGESFKTVATIHPDAAPAPVALSENDLAVMNPYDNNASPEVATSFQTPQDYFAPVIAATQAQPRGALKFSFDSNSNLSLQRHASKQWVDIVIPEDKDDFHVDAYIPKKETPAPRRKLVRRASVLEDDLQIMEGHAEDQFANL